MKFPNYILLFISSIFIKNINAISTECADETSEYRDCLDFLGYDSLELETKYSINDFCSVFEEKECAKFVNDISKSNTVCYSETEKRQSDLSTIEPIMRMRIAYMLFCAKGTNGDYCPFSDHVKGLYEDIDEYTTELSDYQLEILTDDCNDQNCNARMISLKSIIETYEKIINNLFDEGEETSILKEPILKLYNNKIFNIYKNGECNSISKVSLINDDNKNNDSKNSSSGAANLQKITYSFNVVNSLLLILSTRVYISFLGFKFRQVAIPPAYKSKSMTNTFLPIK